MSTGTEDESVSLRAKYLKFEKNQYVCMLKFNMFL